MAQSHMHNPLLASFRVFSKAAYVLGHARFKAMPWVLVLLALMFTCCQLHISKRCMKLWERGSDHVDIVSFMIIEVP